MTETQKAHVGLALAMVFFGLMAPFSKDAMNSGITGLQMATLRISGAAVLFWLATPFTKRQNVPRKATGRRAMLGNKDMLRILLASILGITIAQGGFVVGLGLTSPINASIEVTLQPVFTLLLSWVILGERINAKTALGVLLGLAGAVILVLQNSNGDGQAIDIRGDLLVLASQLSFAVYLTIFRDIIQRYSLLTFNRWMFTIATLTLLPLSWGEMAQLNVSGISLRTLLEIAYIIVVCSFITFLLVVNSQRHLPSTVVSTYNYIQPAVTVIASILMGVAVLSVWQVIAAAFIFSGVWLVTRSRAKQQGKQ